MTDTIPTNARFYDGHHPVAHEVSVRATPTELFAVAPDGKVLARWPSGEIEVASDAEHEPHALMVWAGQPGARLAVEDSELRGAIAGLTANLARVAPRRTRIAPALAGLALGIAATIGAFAVALETAPHYAAPFVPHAWQRSLGDSVVDSMIADMRQCRNPEGLAALQLLVDRLQQVSSYDRKVDVTVVSNKVVNAFAVPGGRMVVFSGLIDKAAGPEEVAGVLGHELGHIVHHHSMQALLRAYGFDMALRLVTGGYSGDLSMVGGAGGVLLALRHGREAERQADKTALELLDKLGMRADGLSGFFGKLLDMQNRPPVKAGGKTDPKADPARPGSGKDGKETKAETERRERDAAAEAGIFSTHPPTRERMETTRRPPTGLPVMTAREWTAVRAVCK
ncbi:MAG: M48 family metallopeptidase [Rhodospirillales bacterium]|nr:MAG: M48 family metallopeptidase [Rhodospirillales bacterium]